jgi:hypothetical protein
MGFSSYFYGALALLMGALALLALLPLLLFLFS